MEPNSTNSVAARVRAWLDVRAADAATLDRVLAEVGGVLDRAAVEHGLAVEVACESRSPAVAFDRALTDRLAACLRGRGLDPVELPTAAGHDAGVLAAAVPSAMLFVRNPTGVSHSPAEHAELSDCLAGVEALAAIVEELACR